MRLGLPSVLALLMGLGLTLLAPGPAAADRHGRIAASSGVALGGFDPVAYFRRGEAQRGDPAIAVRWRGVRWHFASTAHRGAFEANPKAYLPQFGGHCPVSVANGRPRPADPEHWTILDGRLYVTAGAAALARFLTETERLHRAALTHWTGPERLAGGD